LHHDSIHFAEARFYFTRLIAGETRAFALVSLYSPPNAYLLQESNNTLVVCGHQGDVDLVVIDVTSIVSVVAMVPFPYVIDGRIDQYFVVEQVGLEVVDADAQEDNE
jgi:hypothetical protein